MPLGDVRMSSDKRFCKDERAVPATSMPKGQLTALMKYDSSVRVHCAPAWKELPLVELWYSIMEGYKEEYREALAVSVEPETSGMLCAPHSGSKCQSPLSQLDCMYMIFMDLGLLASGSCCFTWILGSARAAVLAVSQLWREASTFRLRPLCLSSVFQSGVWRHNLPMVRVRKLLTLKRF